jgi:hypothetical protein
LLLSISDCRKILLRSEHPQDYSWKSWLLPTREIYRKNDWEFEIYGDDFYGYTSPSLWWIIAEFNKNLKENCESNWLDFKDASYSIWEHISWDNYSIVEDSSVQWNYYIYENFIWWENIIIKKDSEITEIHRKLITKYEEYRNFERFDNRNCPIMEFQYKIWWENKKNENELFFLQYLKTREIEQANFSLDNRELEDNEYQAMFVRGITPPEWIEINFWSVSTRLKDNEIEWFVFETVNDFFKWYQKEIENIAQKNIPMCLIVNPFTTVIRGSNILDISQGHAPKSFLHKPPLSIIISKRTWKELFWFFCSNIKLTKVKILSDWKKAYLKLV